MRRAIVPLVMTIVLLSMGFSAAQNNPGTILTAQEFLQIDVNQDFCSQALGYEEFREELIFYFNCTYFKKHGLDEFIVVQNLYRESYPREDYNKCVSRFTQDHCNNNVVVPNITERVNFFWVHQIREDVQRLQRDAKVRPSLGSFNFNMREINRVR